MRLNYLLLLPFLQGSIATECPCEGIVIPGSDQNHCWEVVKVDSGGWVGGDIACQKLGGHLGHLNTDIEKLTPYLAQVYSRPILTGIIAGNLETDRFGLVCPNNNYYGLMSETETSQLLSQVTESIKSNCFLFHTNGSTSTCVFLTDGNFKVLLAPCTTVADALCDRPVDKPDYCNMKINCSMTTTERTTTRSTTTRTSTSTSSATTRSSSTTTSATIPTEITTNTTKRPAQSTTSVTQSPTTKITENTSSTKTTTQIPTGIPTTTTTVGLFTNKTTKVTSPTVAPISTSSTKVTDHQTTPSSSPSTAPSTAPSTSPSTSPSTRGSNAPTPIVPPPTQCKNDDCENKIFSLCIPWWAWILAFALALLLLFLACCCGAWCCAKGKKKSQQEQPGVHGVTVPSKPKDIEAVNPVLRYSPEPPQPTLPPMPTESTPVVVFPIPFQMTPPQPRREVVEKFTKEIHVIEKEKAIFKDVGTNTDPWIPTIEVAPRKDREILPVPLDNDDLGDDISIDIPRSPSPDRDTIAPVGDLPVLFSRNAKPNQFDGKRPPQTPEEHQEFVNPPEKDPATVISLTADPRNFRSPPLKQKNVHLPTQEVPSFSPISDISDDVDLEGERKPKPRFPSPPRNKPKFPVDEQTPRGDEDYDNKGPASRAPSRGKSGSGLPTNGNSPNGSSGPREPEDNVNAPYNGRRSAQPSSGGAAPLMKPPDVSIRAARGRLGGVVRAGGGPEDNAPQGWKPWAKTSKNFQPSGFND